ncbi:MAG: hypothetical protein D6785_02065, partial [Planctomycetota bacterium]
MKNNACKILELESILALFHQHGFSSFFQNNEKEIARLEGPHSHLTFFQEWKERILLESKTKRPANQEKNSPILNLVLHCETCQNCAARLL